jgi:glycine cleavage system H protein
MPNAPVDLKFTKSHEWVKAEGGRYRVGITDFAQEAMGDIVFVELPKVGAERKAGDTLVVIESVKAVSDVYSPIAGKVVEVNTTLESAPGSINEAPYDNWIFVIESSDAAGFASLLDAEAYLKFLAEEGK